MNPTPAFNLWNTTSGRVAAPYRGETILALSFSGVAFDKREGHPRVFTASLSKAILSPPYARHAKQK